MYGAKRAFRLVKWLLLAGTDRNVFVLTRPGGLTGHRAAARLRLADAATAIAANDPNGAASNLSTSLVEFEAALNAVNWPGPNPGLQVVGNRRRALPMQQAAAQHLAM